MGSQQLLLLVLGTIIVAVAIAVGITQFHSYHTEAIGDEVQEQLLNLSAEAITYFKKPSTLGGGGMSFNGYTLPRSMSLSANASYSVGIVGGGSGVMLVAFTKNSGDHFALFVTHHDADPEFTFSIDASGDYKNRSVKDQPFM